MIAHQRVGAEVDGEDLDEFGQSFAEPVAPVLVITSRGRIGAAQKRASYAAARAMVVGGLFDADERRSGSGHP